MHPTHLGEHVFLPRVNGTFTLIVELNFAIKNRAGVLNYAFLNIGLVFLLSVTVLPGITLQLSYLTIETDPLHYGWGFPTNGYIHNIPAHLHNVMKLNNY